MLKNVNKFKCFLMLRVVRVHVLQAGAAKHSVYEEELLSENRGEAESFYTSLPFDHFDE